MASRSNPFAGRLPPHWPALQALLPGVLLVFALAACDNGIEPTRCTFTLAPPGSSFPGGGGDGTVTVTASDGSCAWTASSSAAWTTIQQGASGTGSGTVTYRVAENPNADPRTATLTIASLPHAISQQGRPPVTCAYALDPTGAAFEDDGGTGSFAVNAPDGCAWTAASSAPFIQITGGANGSGNGTVSYRVDENNASSGRTGTIAVADQTFTVTQLHELICNYSVAPVEFTPCMDGRTLSTQVTAPAGCTWTAASNVPWLTITAGASGSGSGQVTFSFTSNYDAPRTGIVMVRWPTPTAGQNVRVAQAGCLYGVSPSVFPGFSQAGGSASFNVMQQTDPIVCGGPTQNACVWSAVSEVPWIRIDTPMPRTGDDRVNFTVEQNTTGQVRTGTVRVRDRMVTVTQGA